PSSAIRTAPAPCCRAAASADKSGQTSADNPSPLRSRAIVPASRPMGANIWTVSVLLRSPGIEILLQKGRFVSHIARGAGEDSAEVLEGRPEVNSLWTKPVLPNRMFVIAAPLFHDGKRPANRSAVLEIAQHQDGVAEVAHVHRCFH